MNILKEFLKSRSKIDLKLLSNGATTLTIDFYPTFKTDIDNIISENFTAYQKYKNVHATTELKSIRLWFAAKTIAKDLI